jgi:hypothetical protein
MCYGCDGKVCSCESRRVDISVSGFQLDVRGFLIDEMRFVVQELDGISEMRFIR